MNIFKDFKEKLNSQGYFIERTDFNRPWGGFLVIEEHQKEKFINQYFTNLEDGAIDFSLKLSPKILIVAPNQRLSWQYHHRRSELWEVYQGTVGVIKSRTDEQTLLIHYNEGDQITLAKGERHRLVGLDEWGIVAEIWAHTDSNHPSDEDDIVRLQDDYSRKTPGI